MKLAERKEIMLEAMNRLGSPSIAELRVYTNMQQDRARQVADSLVADEVVLKSGGVGVSPYRYTPKIRRIYKPLLSAANVKLRNNPGLRL